MGQKFAVDVPRVGNIHLMQEVHSMSFHAGGLKSWALDYPMGQTAEDQPALKHLGLQMNPKHWQQRAVQEPK